MSRTYFRYLLKKYLKVFLVLAIISLFFLPLNAITAEIRTSSLPIGLCNGVFVNTDVKVYYGSDLGFGFHSIITIALAIIIPFFLHQPFYNRNQLDADLALPIKKGEIVTTSFVFGILTLISISLLSFSIGFTIFALRGLPLRFGMVVLYFLAIILIALFMYILVYFSLAFVHTTLDAVMLLSLIMLLPIIIGGALQNTFGYYSNNPITSISDFFLGFNPLIAASSVQKYFSHEIIRQPASTIYYLTMCDDVVVYGRGIFGEWQLIDTIALSIYPLLGGGLTFLTLRRIVSDKAEYAGTKETAPYLVYFGIIIVGFFALLAFGDLHMISSLFLYVFVATSYFVAMFINARKVTLSKQIVIPFVVMTLVVLIIRLIVG